MKELLQYCDKMTDAALAMSKIVSTDIEDNFERVQLLQEIDTLMKYGIHNLRQSIENLDATKTDTP